MPNRLLTLLTLLAILTVGTTLPASDTPYALATRPFFLALDHKCPTKKLQDLPPGDLNYQVELFEPSLTPAQDRDFTKAAKKACAKSIAGTGCGNVAFLDTAEREHFLDQFVDYLCSLPASCTAFLECTVKP